MEAELRSLGRGRSRLRWHGGPLAARVPVCPAFDLVAAEIITASSDAGEMFIEQRAAEWPWVYVATDAARGRWITDRVIGLGAAANLRDLGGYRGRDGRRIGWRRLFRSNRLDRLSDEDLDRIGLLGIAVGCDLRSAEEQQMEVSRWRIPPKILLLSQKSSNRGIREKLMGGRPGEDEVVARMCAFYADLPLRFADEYRALFTALADGQIPLLFHCTAGKDRTGVAAAILLDLLGVSLEQIVADYSLTDELLEAERQARLDRSALGGDDRDIFASLSSGARLAVWSADPRYIGAALNSVTARFGSSEGYLEQLGLSAATASRLREHLLVREGEEHL